MTHSKAPANAARALSGRPLKIAAAVCVHRHARVLISGLAAGPGSHHSLLHMQAARLIRTGSPLMASAGACSLAASSHRWCAAGCLVVSACTGLCRSPCHRQLALHVPAEHSLQCWQDDHEGSQCAKLHQQLISRAGCGCIEIVLLHRRVRRTGALVLGFQTQRLQRRCACWVAACLPCSSLQHPACPCEAWCMMGMFTCQQVCSRHTAVCMHSSWTD